MDLSFFKQKKSSRLLPLVLLSLLFLSHIPFLDADPDRAVDVHTRGAWTDEGLYASQLLNFIETGKPDLHENSTFVRGPLFNLVQLPFFLLSGPHRLTARLVVLFLLMASIWVLSRASNMQLVVSFLIPIALFQYQLFHFSHYAMAEMLCVASILLSLSFFIGKKEDQNTSKALFWSSFFLFVAYGLKVQYLYVAAILPLATCLKWISLRIKKVDGSKQAFREFRLAVVFTLMWALLYFLLWYLPNQDFYQYIMGSEVSGRYRESFVRYFRQTRFNIQHILWETPAIGLVLGLFAAILYFIFKKPKHPNAGKGILFITAWLILEVHKLPMTYLPQRYLLSFYIVTGLFLAFMLAQIWISGIFRRGLVITTILALFSVNVSHYWSSLKTRSYELNAVNSYLKKYELDGQVILGPWAASMSWGTHAITKPVWNNYFNYEDPIARFDPVMVISEEDEEDSGETYRSQGIDLIAIADSVRTFPVWRYEVRLYWMKPAQVIGKE